MNERTAIKKKGRFIKKGDPLKQHLDVIDFNLMDICESTITHCDNPNGNIIHQNLHTNEEIQKIEESPDEISHVFNRKETRPVIRPINFTSEWEKIMEKQNSKHLATMEEDEIDNEMAEYAKQLREKKFQKEAGYTEDDITAADPIDNDVPVADDIQDDKPLIQELPDQNKSEVTSPLNINDTLEEIRASDDDDSSERSLPNDTVVDEPDVKLDEGTAVEENTQLIEDNKERSEFVESQFAPIMNQEELKELEIKAHKKGYEDGFILGEEKGILSSEEKIDQIHQELSSVITELKGLKKSILMSAQENFRTIAQAMVESLIEKDFQVSDDAFGKFIDKAVMETTTDDDFTILVSSLMFEKLKQYNSDIEKHLRIDDSLDGSNFKIETKLGSVDGQVKKIISELLDKVDLNIIDNKAG